MLIPSQVAQYKIEAFKILNFNVNLFFKLKIHG
jgi:hypothetical protein